MSGRVLNCTHALSASLPGWVMQGTEVQGAEFLMFGAWKRRPRELTAMVNQRERKEGKREKKDGEKGRERGRKERGREEM